MNRRRRPVKSPFRQAAKVAQPKPPRGVKLKTVSRLTLLFAFVCLGAFVAGRPPAESQGHAASAQGNAQVAQAKVQPLRNDDAGHVLFSLGR